MQDSSGYPGQRKGVVRGRTYLLRSLLTLPATVKTTYNYLYAQVPADVPPLNCTPSGIMLSHGPLTPGYPFVPIPRHLLSVGFGPIENCCTYFLFGEGGGGNYLLFWGGKLLKINVGSRFCSSYT